MSVRVPPYDDIQKYFVKDQREESFEIFQLQNRNVYQKIQQIPYNKTFKTARKVRETLSHKNGNIVDDNFNIVDPAYFNKILQGMKQSFSKVFLPGQVSPLNLSNFKDLLSNKNVKQGQNKQKIINLLRKYEIMRNMQENQINRLRDKEIKELDLKKEEKKMAKKSLKNQCFQGNQANQGNQKRLDQGQQNDSKLERGLSIDSMLVDLRNEEEEQNAATFEAREMLKNDQEFMKNIEGYLLQYKKCNNIDNFEMGEGANNEDYQRELARINRTQYYQNSETIFQRNQNKASKTKSPIIKNQLQMKIQDPSMQFKSFHLQKKDPNPKSNTNTKTQDNRSFSKDPSTIFQRNLKITQTQGINSNLKSNKNNKNSKNNNNLTNFPRRISKTTVHSQPGFSHTETFYMSNQQQDKTLQIQKTRTQMMDRILNANKKVEPQDFHSTYTTLGDNMLTYSFHDYKDLISKNFSQSCEHSKDSKRQEESFNLSNTVKKRGLGMMFDQTDQRLKVRKLKTYRYIQKVIKQEQESEKQKILEREVEESRRKQAVQEQKMLQLQKQKMMGQTQNSFYSANMRPGSQMRQTDTNQRNFRVTSAYDQRQMRSTSHSFRSNDIAPATNTKVLIEKMNKRIYKQERGVKKSRKSFSVYTQAFQDKKLAAEIREKEEKKQQEEQQKAEQDHLKRIQRIQKHHQKKLQKHHKQANETKNLSTNSQEELYKTTSSYNQTMITEQQLNHQNHQNYDQNQQEGPESIKDISVTLPKPSTASAKVQNTLPGTGTYSRGSRLKKHMESRVSVCESDKEQFQQRSQFKHMLLRNKQKESQKLDQQKKAFTDFREDLVDQRQYDFGRLSQVQQDFCKKMERKGYLGMLKDKFGNVNNLLMKGVEQGERFEEESQRVRELYMNKFWKQIQRKEMLEKRIKLNHREREMKKKEKLRKAQEIQDEKNRITDQQKRDSNEDDEVKSFCTQDQIDQEVKWVKKQVQRILMN